MKTPTTKVAPRTLKLKLRTMTITREGDLMVHIDPAGSHCGPAGMIVKEGDKSLMPVKYTARVVCAPTVDDRGFLFDQAMLDKWLQRVAAEKTGLSCELLCQAYAERFLAKMEHDRPDCEVRYLSLTLSPAPHKASITVEYGE